MLQPTYSPDFILCDFFLFPKLKGPKKGWRFAAIEEIKAASQEVLKTIPKSAYQKCFGIRKITGTTLLYLRGITVKGTIYTLMNK